VAREYGKYQTRFWTDPKVLQLSKDGKLAFLYLLGGSETNCIGIFRILPAHLAASEVMTVAEAEAALAEITAAGLAEYDSEAKVVFMKNWLRYNPICNVSTAKAAVSALRTVPDSHLKAAAGKLLEPILQPFSKSLPKHWLELCRHECRHECHDVCCPPIGIGKGNGMGNGIMEEGGPERSERSKLSLLPPPPREPFIEMPVKDGEEPIYEDEIGEWITLYGNIDVRKKLRHMRGHWLAKPRNQRKTRRGIRKSIAGWLAKDDDRAFHGGPGRGSKLQSVQRAVAEFDEELDGRIDP